MSVGAKLIPIGAGVDGCIIGNDRFKTAKISLNLLVPLRENSVSANAMVPYMLGRACLPYPDHQKLNARLAELYGADLSVVSDKLGDWQLLRISISMVDDRYALFDDKVVAGCGELIKAILFQPPLEGGTFRSQDFDSEKRLFVERIESEINEKRRYAISRCERAMCKDEPYGIHKYGSLENACSLTSDGVHRAWRNLLEQSIVRIHVLNGDPDYVFDAFGNAFGEINRRPVPKTPQIVREQSGDRKESADRMAVTQSKLCMGFRSGIAETDPLTPAAWVMTDLFGGSPHSKLFLNVREKLSLCYYCAARYNRQKGIIMVDSGVEEQNIGKAKNEILRQLQSIQENQFTDGELDASKKSIINSLLSLEDTPYGLDGWYMGRIFEEDLCSPRDMADIIRAVTREQVAEAAARVALDTVYTLTPEGGRQ